MDHFANNSTTSTNNDLINIFVCGMLFSFDLMVSFTIIFFPSLHHGVAAAVKKKLYQGL